MIIAKHYAIIGPGGKMFINHGSNTNGLYSSKGRAQAVLDKEKTRYKGGSSMYDDYLVVPINIVLAEE